MNTGRFVLTATADDTREGLTLAELREFLAQCEMCGIPDNARIRARQTRAFHRDGGRLTTLAVDQG